MLKTLSALALSTALIATPALAGDFYNKSFGSWTVRGFTMDDGLRVCTMRGSGSEDFGFSIASIGEDDVIFAKMPDWRVTVTSPEQTFLRSGTINFEQLDGSWVNGTATFGVVPPPEGTQLPADTITFTTTITSKNFFKYFASAKKIQIFIEGFGSRALAVDLNDSRGALSYLARCVEIRGK